MRVSLGCVGPWTSICRTRWEKCISLVVLGGRPILRSASSINLGKLSRPIVVSINFDKSFLSDWESDCPGSVVTVTDSSSAVRRRILELVSVVQILFAYTNSVTYLVQVPLPRGNCIFVTASSTELFPADWSPQTTI